MTWATLVMASYVLQKEIAAIFHPFVITMLNALQLLPDINAFAIQVSLDFNVLKSFLQIWHSKFSVTFV